MESGLTRNDCSDANTTEQRQTWHITYLVLAARDFRPGSHANPLDLRLAIDDNKIPPGERANTRVWASLCSFITKTMKEENSSQLTG